MTALGILLAGQAHPARPWPRYALQPDAWRAFAVALQHEPHLHFHALWADAAQVFALFTGPGPLLVSTPAEAGLYAALSPYRPAAAWFERMAGDLWGHQAAHGVDARPWLDHGAWPVLRPMLARSVPNPGGVEAPEMLPVPHPGLHRLVSGPAGPGLAEPGHAVIAASGETVARLELRLGYAHKGTLALMRGKTPSAAARLAGRLAGEATVAHTLAFCRALEAAVGGEAPPRADALRGIAAELERIAVHLADLEQCLFLAGSSAAGPGRLREAVLRAVQSAFGHRFAMDYIVPGGVAADLSEAGAAAIRAVLDHIGAALPSLRRGWGAGLRRRMAGIGVIPPGTLDRLAPHGMAARAAGQGRDARSAPGYPPYPPGAPMVHATGDVLARLDLRLDEVEQGAALVHGMLAALPGGAIEVPPPPGTGEGLGVAEGPHGPVWHWVQVERGAVAAAFARDPGWVLWPAAEAAACGAALSDLKLILASFGASVSGVDL